MTLKLGVNLPQTQPYDYAHDVITFARCAEEIGYDSLWALERLLKPMDTSGVHGLYGVPDLGWPEQYGSVADPLIVLAMAAAVTERIQIGTGVLVPPLHLPVRLAKALAALDAGSGGRLIAGLGVGWSIDEFAATAPRPFAERGAALEEFLDVASAVWGPDPVTIDTDRFSVAPAQINPKPGRRIPVYLGGNSRPALRRVARRADGWLPSAIAPSAVRNGLEQIRQTAAEHGREPESISCVFQIAYGSTAEVPTLGRQPYTGSVRQLVEDIAALAEAGVHHVYVSLPYATTDLKSLIGAAEELHEAVRGAGL
ncbi:TIGR03619 family F420-dependent LLM class oxidoreductase [Paractinoplanes toevensis]|uniref:LLM class F420-dependent oxidoreductase n=1 Tax=Paractinoplanes toevensis TaxID=571911 RepID=A0A919W3N7_9ACTN|nr:TIGR03619 family F420-dependent LLM class oxidoreductase [Actinoplanes toevensis]GIM92989.1 LLM class F420-dependent oxidoreductase [Actinoplanes toevensis]